MIVNQDILEVQFNKFVDFIQSESDEKFKTFKDSVFLNSSRGENYKYKVYDEARDNLANKNWKPEDIGTGKIQKKVNSAIKAKVNFNYEMVDNNLIDWRKKDDFSKIKISEKLETTFYQFYKSNLIKGSEAFDLFMKQGLTYQFIAYLFFIKDRKTYLPISQKQFDKIFKEIDLPDFKTNRNASWENYSEFCDIIKQVQQFLKSKDKNATLLDAHSFLWILGEIADNNTAKKDKFEKPILRENVGKLSEDIDLVEKTSDLNTTIYIANEKVSNSVSDVPEKPSLVEKTDYPDILTDIDNKKNIIDSLPEKEREIYTKARIGQGKFREELINHWQGCSVTGYQNIGILIASHIKPWRDCDAKEATDMWNGLLLIPNLDKLFDKGFISFDNEGIIMFSPLLSLEDVEQLGVKKDMRLHHIHPHHQKYLEYHRTKYFTKRSDGN